MGALGADARTSQEGHTEGVKLLLDKGADVNVADSKGNTALIVASFNGHEEIAKLLLDAHQRSPDDLIKTWVVLICLLFV